MALIKNGQPIEVNERDLAGFPIRIPSLDVNAVGAGGGSIAWIDRDGLLKVGPQSAGAEPGPACYDMGGRDATVTDANVLLGRLNGEALLAGRMPIKKELSKTPSLAGRSARCQRRRSRARDCPGRLRDDGQGDPLDIGGARAQSGGFRPVRLWRGGCIARGRRRARSWHARVIVPPSRGSCAPKAP